jgi:hypothetical protein
MIRENQSFFKDALTGRALFCLFCFCGKWKVLEDTVDRVLRSRFDPGMPAKRIWPKDM